MPIVRIIEKMRFRRFNEGIRSYNGNGDLESIIFTTEESLDSKGRTIPSYNCVVHPNTEEFEFTYVVPNSINKLCTPRCGSIMLDGHFDRLCAKFEEHISVLHKFGGF